MSESAVELDGPEMRKFMICCHAKIILSLLFKDGTRHKDTACKGDLRNETEVTLKWKCFSESLHSVIHRTNLIVCFDHTLNLGDTSFTGLGKRVGPRFGESRLLASSGRGRRVHAT